MALCKLFQEVASKASFFVSTLACVHDTNSCESARVELLGAVKALLAARAKPVGVQAGKRPCVLAPGSEDVEAEPLPTLPQVLAMAGTEDDDTDTPGDVARVTACLALAYCYVQRRDCFDNIDSAVESIVGLLEVYIDE